MKSEVALIPSQRIERVIYLIRGQKVMLDRDLAQLYGVETRLMNLPAASCGVSKTARNEASFGEFTLRD